MRIDGATSGQAIPGLNSANANRPGNVDSGTAPASAATDQATAAGQFQPTSDFAPLSGALGRIPLVRQEVLGEVAKQLTGGELDTPQAREQTVQSILGAAPGHD
jgi:hypothetical protein